MPLLRATGCPGVVSMVKMTVPPAVAGATLARKLTPWPKTEGLADEVSVVAVGDLTVWTTAVDELVAKLGSPGYEALIECGPGERLDELNVA